MIFENNSRVNVFTIKIVYYYFNHFVRFLVDYRLLITWHVKGIDRNRISFKEPQKNLKKYLSML